MMSQGRNQFLRKSNNQHWEMKTEMIPPDSQSIALEGTQKSFYDLKQIENISILDVCQHFGIPIYHRGGKPWCKLRPNEKTPSTIIHTEGNNRYKANTFYDFGVHEGGNNISLACMMMGLDRNNDTDRFQAIQYLAEAFHIAPMGHETSHIGSLTNSQYARIGLYGDLATKNFSFDTAHMDLEKIQEISEKYAMPMNQLKKEHPHTFERLLKRISIPFIEEFRNGLYMDIWIGREAARTMQTDNHLFFQLQDYTDDLQQLRDLDGIFARAVIGTKLKEFQNREYDPAAILKKIDDGILKPKFGSRTFQQMQRLAKRCRTSVKYRPLDAYSFYFHGTAAMGNIPYSGFLDKGKAVIGYLEKDYELLRPAFLRFTCSVQSKLEEKLQSAEHRASQNQMPERAKPTSEQVR